jgi:hypothetical protein
MTSTNNQPEDLLQRRFYSFTVESIGSGAADLPLQRQITVRLSLPQYAALQARAMALGKDPSMIARRWLAIGAAAEGISPILL